MSRKSRALFLTQALERSLARLGCGNSRGLLAVSGGADSMALLQAASRINGSAGVSVEVATVDHGLRAEAADEARQVEAAATARGLIHHTRRVEVGAGSGLEARARTLREAALEEVRAERGLDWIATAHTATDQAETVLMRLGRGSALRGAAGILERKGRFVRPLLEVTREEVLGALEEWGVGYVSDPMNSDRAFTRVRVRSEVLPAITGALGPEAVPHLAAFARAAAEDEALLSLLAEDAARRLLLPGGGWDAVGLRALLRPLRMRVLRGWLEQQGVTPSRIAFEALEEALATGTHCALDRELTFRAEGGVARLERATAPAGPERYSMEPGADLLDLSSGLRLRLTPAPVSGSWSLPLGAEALPLLIRRRSPGDRVLLSSGRTAKLQDVLVDARVPVEQRESLPIVVGSNGAVLAVAGVWPRNPQGSGEWHLVVC